MLMNFMLVITSIFTLTGFLGNYGCWLDLTAHFRAQYLVIQLLGVFFYSSQKHWGFLTVALLAASTNLALIAPLYLPLTPVPSPQRKNISIIMINVNSSNNEYRKVINYVKEMQPDILALEEIDDRWISALGPLLAGYPYQKFQSRTDSFGIGLFSKIPTETLQTIYFAPALVPSIAARYKIGTETFTLLFTHLVPPQSAQYYQLRNGQMSAMAALRPAWGKNLILVGDLNTTSWSYYFNDFLKKMGLVDTRRGFGLQISWPTMSPLMGIAIDHILVSPNIHVSKRSIGPYVGSDHYPVYVSVGIPE